MRSLRAKLSSVFLLINVENVLLKNVIKKKLKKFIFYVKICYESQIGSYLYGFNLDFITFLIKICILMSSKDLQHLSCHFTTSSMIFVVA